MMGGVFRRDSTGPFRGRGLVALIGCMAIFAMHGAGGGGHDHGGSMASMASTASVTGHQAEPMQHQTPRRANGPSRTGPGPAVSTSSACAVAALTAPPCLIVDQRSEPIVGPSGTDEPGSMRSAPEPPVPRTALFT